MAMVREAEERCLIDWIPEEVKLQILSYLSFTDLGQVALLSSSWNLLAADDVLWRELEPLPGMSDKILYSLLGKHPRIASFKWRSDICCLITEQGLTQLCVQCGSYLTRLCLEACDEVTSELLGIIAQFCLSLQHLDVSANPCIDDVSMCQLAACPSLSSLRVSNCDRITDAGLEVLLQSRPLSLLDTSHLLEIRSRTLQNLVTYTSSTLTSLWLDGGNLTDEDMSHVSELPLLRYLEIQYCDEIGDEGLQHLSKLSRLKTLKLARCFSLSSSCLDGLLASLQLLQVLVLSDCTELDDLGLVAIGRHSSSLLHLELSQSFRHSLTDAGMSAVLRGCPGLRSLTLRGLKAVRTFVTLVPVLPLPHLRTLDLSGCQNISPALLHTVAGFCPGLAIYGNYGSRVKPGGWYPG